MQWPSRCPFFYGWVVVAVSFVCLLVGYAVWLSFSIFYVAILEEFGWSRAATAATFSVFTIVYGFSSMASGGLVDRFGPRRVMPLAALIVGGGLLLTSRLTTTWEFYLFFGVLVAIGLSGFGMVPVLTLINAWFVRKRGVAVGLATAGIGTGALLLVPLLQTIIMSQGWRTAYVVLAIGIVAVVPVLAAIFQRHRPQELGLLPDGELRDSRPNGTRAERIRENVLIVDKEWASRDWSLPMALRTGRFKAILLGRYLELVVINVLLTHQVAYLVDSGFDRLLAASVVGAVGIVGSASQILWGFVSDRIGREVSFILSFSAGTAGVAIMLFIGPGAPAWALYAYALAFGLCYGAGAVLMPVSTADIFQGRGFGSILGALYVGGGLGAATGAFLGGYLFDLVGSYSWAFALAIPAIWVSCLLYWLAAPRKVRLVAGKARLTSAER